MSSCVNGAATITKGRLCEVCECIGTGHTCMNSWK